MNMIINVNDRFYPGVGSDGMLSRAYNNIADLFPTRST